MNIRSIKSITFPEVRKFLKEYIESKPEYESKWKDFFESGAGTNLIDVAAGVTAFLGFNSYMARKDSLLDYSSLPSTIMTIASTLGYVYNRKSAPRLRLTLNCSRNIAWKKEEPIGSINGRDISLLEDTIFKVGTHKYDVVVGNWAAQETVINESKDFYNLSIDGIVDNNYYNLYLNDERVKLEVNQEDLRADSVLIRSHKEGVYLIFGNNVQGRKAEIATNLKFEYIVPAEKFQGLNFNTKDLQINVDCEIEHTQILSQGSNADSSEKLVALAPGYYGTQRTLISYSDYEYIGASFEGLVSCKAKPHTKKCCAVDVFYLREDEQRFTATQLQEFEDYLEKHSMMGTAYYVYPPSPIDVQAQVKIVLKNPVLKDDVEKLITDHLQFQCMKLGGTFTMASISGLELPDGTRVYIDYPIQDKVAKEWQYFRLQDLQFKYISKDTPAEISQGIDLQKGYVEYEYKYSTNN